MIRKLLTISLILISLIYPLAGALTYYYTEQKLDAKQIFINNAYGLLFYGAKGTAEFIDDKGTMLTAYHVAGNVKDMCVDVGGLCYKAKLIAGDLWTDVAVIKINYHSPYYARLTCLPPSVGSKLTKLGYGGWAMTEYDPVVRSGTITQMSVVCPCENYCCLFNENSVTPFSEAGDSGGLAVDRTGGIAGIISCGSLAESDIASYSSIKHLLDASHVYYETTNIWGKPLSWVTYANSKTVKVIWVR